jgi:hypothetical protein
MTIVDPRQFSRSFSYAKTNHPFDQAVSPDHSVITPRQRPVELFAPALIPLGITPSVELPLIVAMDFDASSAKAIEIRDS